MIPINGQEEIAEGGFAEGIKEAEVTGNLEIGALYSAIAQRQLPRC